MKKTLLISLLCAGAITLHAAMKPDVATLSVAEINKVKLPPEGGSPVPLYPAGRSLTPDVYPENCDAACIQRIAEKTRQERKTPRANERTSGTGVPVDRIFYEPNIGNPWGDYDVVYHNGLYHLFYCAWPYADPYTLLTSKDAVNWEFRGGVLDVNFDELFSNTLNVHSLNGRFIMEYHTGYIDPKLKMNLVRRYATSKDLIHWERVSPMINFPCDTNHYTGRCEGNYLLRDGHGEYVKTDGYYHGIWCAVSVSKGLGCGFGRSKDGLHWEALPAIHTERLAKAPAIKAEKYNILGEVTGFFLVDGTYYIVSTDYHRGKSQCIVVSSKTMEGPYAPVENNPVLGSTLNFYIRFCKSANGDILTNPHIFSDSYLRDLKVPRIFAVPPFDRVEFEDGSMWLRYWSGNDVIKKVKLDLKAEKSQSPITYFENRFDAGKGLFFEGTFTDRNTSSLSDKGIPIASISASSTVPSEFVENAFLPANAIDNKPTTEWVGQLSKDTPVELVLDLKEPVRVGCARLNWVDKWPAQKVSIEYFENGQWKKAKAEPGKHPARAVSLFENINCMTGKIKLRLTTNKPEVSYVGLKGIKLYEASADRLQDHSGAGLFIECDADGSGYVILCGKGNVKTGYVDKDGGHFNYENDRDIPMAGNKPGAHTFKVILRDQFVSVYLDDYAAAMLVLRKQPTGRIGTISIENNLKITEMSAWEAK